MYSEAPNHSGIRTGRRRGGARRRIGAQRNLHDPGGRRWPAGIRQQPQGADRQGPKDDAQHD
eukprot:9946300-Alexandrium_andersonii.AAC.1